MSTCLALSRSLRISAVLRQPQPAARSAFPSASSLLVRSLSTSAAALARRLPGGSSANSPPNFDELLANVSERQVASSPSPSSSLRFASAGADFAPRPNNQERWRIDKFEANKARIKAARAASNSDRSAGYGGPAGRNALTESRYRSSAVDESPRVFGASRGPRSEETAPRRRLEDDDRREPSYARRPDYEPPRRMWSRFGMDEDASPPRRRFDDANRPAPRYRPDDSLSPRRRLFDDGFDGRPVSYGRDDRGPPPRRFDDDDADRRPSYAPRDREDRSPARNSYGESRAPYGESRTPYDGRSRAPFDEGRAPYGREREDRPAYSPRAREARPSYGRDREDQRPAYSRNDESRPAYGREGSDRPAYARDREARPAYTRDGDSRPAFTREREARPAQGRDRDERPASIRDRSERQPAVNRLWEKPARPPVSTPVKNLIATLDDKQKMEVALGGRTPEEELDEQARTLIIFDIPKSLSVKRFSKSLIRKMPFLQDPNAPTPVSESPSNTGPDAAAETEPLPDLVSAETAAEGGASETVIEAAVEPVETPEPTASAGAKASAEAEPADETAVNESPAEETAAVESKTPVKEASSSAIDASPASLVDSQPSAPAAAVAVLPGRLVPLEQTEMIYSYPAGPEGALFQIYLYRQLCKKKWGEKGWEGQRRQIPKYARVGLSNDSLGFAFVRFASRELAQQALAAGSDLSTLDMIAKEKAGKEKKEGKPINVALANHSFTAARNHSAWADKQRAATAGAAAGAGDVEDAASASQSRKPWMPDPASKLKMDSKRFKPRSQPMSRKDDGGARRSAPRGYDPHNVRDD